MIRVIKPGLLTTVQDLGRFGYAHLGVSPAGAADPISLRAVNLLVGNDENAPALEMTLLSPVLEFEIAATVAITGSSLSSSTPLYEAIEVCAGQRLELGSLTSHARCYLAVRGGVSVPEIMGCASTFLPACIGGYEGRALRSGDLLAIGHRAASGVCRADASRLRQLIACAPLRTVAAPQSEWYTGKAQEMFYSQVFRVSDHSNRSGLRLTGDPIRAKDSRELLTEGIALGAVQVPADGQPIMLFVDQQTTGGYPKIANVIAADLPRVGQLRPRDEIKFELVTIDEAIAALRERERIFREAFS